MRTVFYYGRIPARRPRFGRTGCAVGRHIGIMLDCPKMDAAGGMWSHTATCSNCHATVGRSEFVGQVA